MRFVAICIHSLSIWDYLGINTHNIYCPNWADMDTRMSCQLLSHQLILVSISLEVCCYLYTFPQHLGLSGDQHTQYILSQLGRYGHQNEVPTVKSPIHSGVHIACGLLLFVYIPSAFGIICGSKSTFHADSHRGCNVTLRWLRRNIQTPRVI